MIKTLVGFYLIFFLIPDVVKHIEELQEEQQKEQKEQRRIPDKRKDL